MAFSWAGRCRVTRRTSGRGFVTDTATEPSVIASDLWSRKFRQDLLTIELGIPAAKSQDGLLARIQGRTRPVAFGLPDRDVLLPVFYDGRSDEIRPLLCGLDTFA